MNTTKTTVVQATELNTNEEAVTMTNTTKEVTTNNTTKKAGTKMTNVKKNTTEAANKFKRTIMAQAALINAVPFVKDAEGNLTPIKGSLSNYVQYVKDVPALSPNVVIVATENNKVGKMKLDNNTAYIIMNESQQARALAQYERTLFQVLNGKGEMVDFLAYDLRTLAAVSFGGVVDGDPEEDEKAMYYINHIFEHGLFMRKEEANEDINELTHMNQLSKYTPILDTPSQTRQAKVTFYSEDAPMTVVEGLRAIGNHMPSYVKKYVTKDGINYAAFAIDKNPKRLGLNGSASIKLAGFAEWLGEYVTTEVLSETEKVVVTTKRRILLCDDVIGHVKTAAKVFNQDIANYKPTSEEVLNGTVKPAYETADNFEWEVNVTDGMIITDATDFASVLRGQRLAGVKRNGKLRGLSHTFRLDPQVKGFNSVLPEVKEMTGYDMILFDGARKSDMVKYLEDGNVPTYSILLVASTFRENEQGKLHPQALNNLDLNAELMASVARENVALAKEALNDKEKAMAVYEVNNGGELSEDEVDSQVNDIVEDFGMKRFMGANDLIWDDIAMKQEIANEVEEFVNTHKNGNLQVRGKYNFMVSDLFSILVAVQNRTYTVHPEEAVLGKGEVAIAMMKEDGSRYFHEGDIVSIRSPHVVHDETQKAKAINVSGVQWYKNALAGGFLDGMTIFSAVDLMAPASSGADFDGDTSLIVIDERIVPAVTKSPQYLNFFMKEEVDYVIQDGKIIGSYDENGKLNTSSSIFGENCPWSNPAPAPEFDLPEGYIQDGFTLYIPVSELGTDEAYAVWASAMHKVVKQSIMPADIGIMSNITMAIVNGLNNIKGLAWEARQQGNTQALERLHKEFKYFTNMKDVFTAIVWYSIDAAKHGGAYKHVLNEWMKWTSGKDMKAELQSESVNSMKRIIGKVPSSVDAYGESDTEYKVAIILPNALREAKHKFTSKKGERMVTNLQRYTDIVKEIAKEVIGEKKELKVGEFNMLAHVSAILFESDFPTQEARNLYQQAVDVYSKKIEPLAKKRREIKAKVRANLLSNGTDFDTMRGPKQNDMMKRLSPEFAHIRLSEKKITLDIRNLLRQQIIARGYDIAKFAAAAYTHSYETSIKAESASRKSKSPFHIFWSLLEDEAIVMLTAMEGAKFSYRPSPTKVNITEMYFVPVKGFDAKALAESGKQLFVYNGEVFIKNGARPTADDKVGTLAGNGQYEFLQNIPYLVGGLTLLRSTEYGVAYRLGNVHCIALVANNVEERTAEQVYESAEETQAPVTEQAPVQQVQQEVVATPAQEATALVFTLQAGIDPMQAFDEVAGRQFVIAKQGNQVAIAYRDGSARPVQIGKVTTNSLNVADGFHHVQADLTDIMNGAIEVELTVVAKN